MATSERSKTPDSMERSTSSPEAFHASQQAKPDYERERAMLDGSGRKCIESFGSFPRATSWQKTFAGCLVSAEGWSLKRSALTWKLSATKYNRLLFQLSPSARRTDATEYGLLPTPRVSETEGAPVKNAEFRNGSWSRQNRKGVRFGVKVKDVIESMNLLPTPATRDYKGGSKTGRDTVDSLIERGATKGQVGIKTGLKLQPDFAGWMMGYPEGYLDLEDGEMPRSKPMGTRSSRT